MAKCTRRQFVRTVGLSGAGFYAATLLSCGGKAVSDADPRILRNNDLLNKLAVAKGGDIENMARNAMKALGGMDKLVKSGDTVVVKPNIGWAYRPELGASSHPETVAAVVKMCLEAGAKTVKVFDRSCDDKRRAYNESGIENAAKSAGADVSYIDESRFVNLQIPDGKTLKEWQVYRDALECDILINVPVPKHHGSTGLTIALKNLMGIAGGKRGEWHRDHDLDTAITDFYTVVPCDLTVIDAHRIILTNGPRGGKPSDVQIKNTLAICKDAIAADAFAAQELFGRKPENIAHIKQAHKRGLGDINYQSRLLEV